MNAQDPLANLHPLREPALIGWWPPAPGWWILACLAILGLLALLWYLLRRYRANAYRRQALVQLHRLQQAFHTGRDPGEYTAGINALLKSVALHAYPRRDVASASGDVWLQFLNARVRAGEKFEAEFTTAAYRRESPKLDMEQVQRAARNWIKRHEVAR